MSINFYLNNILVDFALVPNSPSVSNLSSFDTTFHFVRQIRQATNDIPGYDVYFVRSQRRFKFFGTLSDNSKRIQSNLTYPWAYPFIDIQLMNAKFEAGSYPPKIASISDGSGYPKYTVSFLLKYRLYAFLFHSVSCGKCFPAATNGF